MGILRFAGNKIQMPTPFTVSTSDPLDERLVVESFNDIKNKDTFKNAAVGSKVYSKVYEGMQVYVVDEKATYMYVGPYDEGYGVSSDEAITAENWRKISDPSFSIDLIESDLNKLAEAAGVSGTASANTFGYSAHTTPVFISNQAPTSIQTEVVAIENALTPTSGTCENPTPVTTATEMHKNIISITKDGIEAFADLHYDSITNKLTFVNTNGSNEIKLNGINFIDHIKYDKETESLIIYYQEQGKSELTLVSIELKDLIEEYNFNLSNAVGTSDTNDTVVADHNVAFGVTRSVDGKSQVYGDIDIFDCGTY